MQIEKITISIQEISLILVLLQEMLDVEISVVCITVLWLGKINFKFIFQLGSGYGMEEQRIPHLQQYLSVA